MQAKLNIIFEKLEQLENNFSSSPQEASPSKSGKPLTSSSVKGPLKHYSSLSAGLSTSNIPREEDVGTDVTPLTFSSFKGPLKIDSSFFAGLNTRNSSNKRVEQHEEPVTSPVSPGRARHDSSTSYTEDVHFEPLIPLPEQVEVQTGEEDEEVMFSSRAKLYRYDKDVSAWKERGIGTLKILYNSQKGRSRILMRREVVHKICANHFITDDMKLTEKKGTTNTWIWNTFADYSEVSKPEQLAARFKTQDEFLLFKEKFEQCQKIPKKDTSKVQTMTQSTNETISDVMAQFYPNADSWSCSVCLVFNEGRTSVCIACGAPKLSALNANVSTEAPKFFFHLPNQSTTSTSCAFISSGLQEKTSSESQFTIGKFYKGTPYTFTKSGAGTLHATSSSAPFTFALENDEGKRLTTSTTGLPITFTKSSGATLNTASSSSPFTFPLGKSDAGITKTTSSSSQFTFGTPLSLTADKSKKATESTKNVAGTLNGTSSSSQSTFALENGTKMNTSTTGLLFAFGKSSGETLNTASSSSLSMHSLGKSDTEIMKTSSNSSPSTFALENDKTMNTSTTALSFTLGKSSGKTLNTASSSSPFTFPLGESDAGIVETSSGSSPFILSMPLSPTSDKAGHDTASAKSVVGTLNTISSSSPSTFALENGKTMNTSTTGLPFSFGKRSEETLNTASSSSPFTFPLGKSDAGITKTTSSSSQFTFGTPLSLTADKSKQATESTKNVAGTLNGTSSSSQSTFALENGTKMNTSTTGLPFAFGKSSGETLNTASSSSLSMHSLGKSDTEIMKRSSNSSPSTFALENDKTMNTSTTALSFTLGKSSGKTLNTASSSSPFTFPLGESDAGIVETSSGSSPFILGMPLSPTSDKAGHDTASAQSVVGTLNTISSSSPSTFALENGKTMNTSTTGLPFSFGKSSGETLNTASSSSPFTFPLGKSDAGIVETSSGSSPFIFVMPLSPTSDKAGQDTASTKSVVGTLNTISSSSPSTFALENGKPMNTSTTGLPFSFAKSSGETLNTASSSSPLTFQLGKSDAGITKTTSSSSQFTFGTPLSLTADKSKKATESTTNVEGTLNATASSFPITLALENGKTVNTSTTGLPFTFGMSSGDTLNTGSSSSLFTFSLRKSDAAMVKTSSSSSPFVFGTPLSSTADKVSASGKGAVPASQVFSVSPEVSSASEPPTPRPYVSAAFRVPAIADKSNTPIFPFGSSTTAGASSPATSSSAPFTFALENDEGKTLTTSTTGLPITFTKSSGGTLNTVSSSSPFTFPLGKSDAGITKTTSSSSQFTFGTPLSLTADKSKQATESTKNVAGTLNGTSSSSQSTFALENGTKMNTSTTGLPFAFGKSSGETLNTASSSSLSMHSLGKGDTEIMKRSSNSSPSTFALENWKTMNTSTTALSFTLGKSSGKTLNTASSRSPFTFPLGESDAGIVKTSSGSSPFILDTPLSPTSDKAGQDTANTKSVVGTLNTIASSFPITLALENGKTVNTSTTGLPFTFGMSSGDTLNTGSSSSLFTFSLRKSDAAMVKTSSSSSPFVFGTPLSSTADKVSASGKGAVPASQVFSVSPEVSSASEPPTPRPYVSAAFRVPAIADKSNTPIIPFGSSTTAGASSFSLSTTEKAASENTASASNTSVLGGGTPEQSVPGMSFGSFNTGKSQSFDPDLSNHSTSSTQTDPLLYEKCEGDSMMAQNVSQKVSFGTPTHNQGISEQKLFWQQPTGTFQFGQLQALPPLVGANLLHQGAAPLMASATSLLQSSPQTSEMFPQPFSFPPHCQMQGTFTLSSRPEIDFSSSELLRRLAATKEQQDSLNQDSQAGGYNFTPYVVDEPGEEAYIHGITMPISTVIAEEYDTYAADDDNDNGDVEKSEDSEDESLNYTSTEEEDDEVEKTLSRMPAMQSPQTQSQFPSGKGSVVTTPVKPVPIHSTPAENGGPANLPSHMTGRHFLTANNPLRATKNQDEDCVLVYEVRASIGDREKASRLCLPVTFFNYTKQTPCGGCYGCGRIPKETVKSNKDEDKANTIVPQSIELDSTPNASVATTHVFGASSSLGQLTFSSLMAKEGDAFSATQKKSSNKPFQGAGTQLFAETSEEVQGQDDDDNDNGDVEKSEDSADESLSYTSTEEEDDEVEKTLSRMSAMQSSQTLSQFASGKGSVVTTPVKAVPIHSTPAENGGPASLPSHITGRHFLTGKSLLKATKKQDEDCVLVYEVRASMGDCEKASRLCLPVNFFNYTKQTPCGGCYGCGRIPKETVKSNKDEDKANTIVPQSIELDSTPKASVATAHIFGAFSSLGQLTFSSLMPKEGDAFSATQKKDSNKPFQGAGTHLFAETSEEVQGQDDDDNDNGDVEKSEDSADESLSYTSTEEEDDEVEETLSRMPAMQSSQTQSQFPSGKGSVVTTPVKPVPIHSTPVDNGGPASLPSHMTGRHFLTAKSPFKATKKQDEDCVLVYEVRASMGDREKASRLYLPVNFFNYTKQIPCGGCYGCGRIPKETVKSNKDDDKANTIVPQSIELDSTPNASVATTHVFGASSSLGQLTFSSLMPKEGDAFSATQKKDSNKPIQGAGTHLFAETSEEVQGQDDDDNDNGDVEKSEDSGHESLSYTSTKEEDDEVEKTLSRMPAMQSSQTQSQFPSGKGSVLTTPVKPVPIHSTPVDNGGPASLPSHMTGRHFLTAKSPFKATKKQDEECALVYEVRASMGDREKASRLCLPVNFFNYTKQIPCGGCYGCGRIPKETVKSNKDEDKANTIVPQSIELDSTPNASVATTHVFGASSSLGQLTFSSLIPKEGDAFSATQKKDSNKPFQGAGTQLFAETSEEVQGQDDDDNDNGDVEKSEDSADESSSYTSTEEEDDEVEKTLSRMPAMQSSQTLSQFASGKGSVVTTPVKPVPIHSTPVDNGGPASLPSHMTGRHFLTAKSPFKATKKQDEDCVLVYEVRASMGDREKASRLCLPVNFFNYTKQIPCGGCYGCGRIPKETVKSNKDEDKANTIVPQSIELDSTPNASVATTHVFGASSSLGQLTFSSLMPKEGDAFSATQKKDSNKPIQGAGTHLFAETSEEVQGQDDDDNDNGDVEKSEDSGHESLSYTSTKEEDDEVEKTLSRMPAMQSSQTQSQFPSGKGSVLTTPVKPVPIHSTPVDNGGPASLPSHMTGRHFLTAKSPFKATKKQDEDCVLVYEVGASMGNREKASRLCLPVNFFNYTKQIPCGGCYGCGRIPKETVKSNKDEDKANTIVPQSIKLDSTPNASVATTHVFGASSSLGQLTFSSLMPKEGDAFSATQKKDSNKPFQGAGTQLFAETSEEVQGQDDDDNDNGDVEKSEDSADESSSYTSTEEEDDEVEKTLSRMPAMQSSQTLSQFASGKGSVVTTPVKAVPIHSTPAENGGPASLPSHITGRHFLTGKSLLKATKKQDEDCVLVYEVRASMGDCEKASRLCLPVNFFNYTKQTPCGGCYGCGRIPKETVKSNKDEDKANTIVPQSIELDSTPKASVATTHVFGASSSLGQLTFSSLMPKEGEAISATQKKYSNKPFQGAGTQLFAETSEEVQGQDDDKHFQPVIPLTDEIQVVTGEEGLEMVFCERAKLYRFDADSGQWKEKGVGEMKLLRHPKSGEGRVLMRREQIKKLCANYNINAGMELKPNVGSDRSWVWYTLADYADGEARPEKLSINFKSVQIAGKFN